MRWHGSWHGRRRGNEQRQRGGEHVPRKVRPGTVIGGHELGRHGVSDIELGQCHETFAVRACAGERSRGVASRCCDHSGLVRGCGLIQ